MPCVPCPFTLFTTQFTHLHIWRPECREGEQLPEITRLIDGRPWVGVKVRCVASSTSPPLSFGSVLRGHLWRLFTILHSPSFPGQGQHFLWMAILSLHSPLICQSVLGRGGAQPGLSGPKGWGEQELMLVTLHPGPTMSHRGELGWTGKVPAVPKKAEHPTEGH